jgi:hypothetical protein
LILCLSAIALSIADDKYFDKLTYTKRYDTL